MSHFEHADRAEQQRRVESPPEQLDARVAAGDVPQDAGHDAVPLEGGAVRAHGALEAGAAGDVPEALGGHHLLGHGLEGGHVDRDAGALASDPTQEDLRLPIAAEAAFHRHGGDSTRGLQLRRAPR